ARDLPGQPGSAHQGTGEGALLDLGARGVHPQGYRDPRPARVIRCRKSPSQYFIRNTDARPMVGTVTTYSVSNSSSPMAGTLSACANAATSCGTVLLCPTTSARPPRFSCSTRL